jgi:glycosyltransferase involved in cell wall biosynthesis
MTLTIALPALNEEAVLRRSVETVRANVAGLMPRWETTVVIADSASSDDTSAIGIDLAARFSDVRYVRMSARGKGLAIRTAWERHPADVLAFMDADLATDLSALPALLAAIDGADVAVGSRYMPGAQVSRSFVRHALSSGYRAATRWALDIPVTDAPCGFKAVRADVWQRVAPHLRNNQWFFDTELLFHAHHTGCRIAEVPVRWTDGGPYGRPSRAVPWSVIGEYVAELRRLRALR